MANQGGIIYCILANTGRQRSDECRQRFSNMNKWKGKKIPPEIIAERVAARAGYRHSEATKEKIRIAARRRFAA